jgi:hypothetical protein
MLNVVFFCPETYGGNMPPLIDRVEKVLETDQRDTWGHHGERPDGRKRRRPIGSRCTVEIALHELKGMTAQAIAKVFGEDDEQAH